VKPGVEGCEMGRAFGYKRNMGNCIYSGVVRKPSKKLTAENERIN